MSQSTDAPTLIDDMRSEYQREFISPGGDPLAVVNGSYAGGIIDLLVRACREDADQDRLAPYDDADDAVVRLAGKCAAIKSLNDPDSDQRSLAAAIHKATRYTAHDLTPVSVPPSWWRVKRDLGAERVRRGFFCPDEAYGGAMSKGYFLAGTVESYLSRIVEEKEPTIEELEHTLLAQYFIVAFSKQQGPLADGATTSLDRVRKTGLLGALERIRAIDALSVTYRPITTSELRALRELFAAMPENPTTKPVTSAAAFDGTRSVESRYKGLHSQVLFGPLSNGTCSCGKYRQWPTVLTCERCGVVTGDSVLRATTTSFLALPYAIRATKTVTIPGKNQPLGYIPITAPAQRAAAIDGTAFILSTADRLYTRMLVVCRLIADLGDSRGPLAPEAASLLTNDLALLLKPPKQ
jgi:hypothetical protein